MTGSLMSSEEFKRLMDKAVEPPAAYMVYYRSADSYHSTAQLPVAVFLVEEDANDWAAYQKGYGFGVDWFVKSVPLNPPVLCHCGNPVHYGFDGDLKHHRGMCRDCDLVRCDAYPGACKGVETWKVLEKGHDA